MRKFFILMIVATLGMGLFLTGCFENITEPEDAKWSVMAMPDWEEEGKATDHVVTVMWIGPASEFVAPTTLELKIGGTNVPLNAYGDYWIGETSLTAGNSYYFQLIVNDETVVNTQQKVVWPADATFPLTFNPTEAAYTYWTVEANNDVQYATAYAYDPEDPYDDEVVDKELGASDREYTFPANIVQDHGEGSMYSLEVTQMNHKYVDNVLVATVQSDWQDYGDLKKIDRFAPANLAKHVRRLSELALR